MSAAPDATDRVEHSMSGSLWRRLQKGLRRTQGQLLERIEAAVGGRLDERTIEDLEEALIGADIGVETSVMLLAGIQADFKAGRGDLARIRERLADEIAVLLLDAPQPHRDVDGPRVTLVVGVNGVGKTTCIAKLAALFGARDRSVLLVAGDTFRAAGIEQLVVWGERLGVSVVRQNSGSDPAAVVFDGLRAAEARRIDEVLVDTAGRLHTQRNLMQELAKIGRVISREAASRELQTLLVLDATTGQNAIHQAREFSSAVDLDGILLTKLDGTAKGGIVVALAAELRLPVLYLGVGEGIEDLIPFEPRAFVRALLEPSDSASG